MCAYSTYDEIYTASIENPNEFWGNEAKKIHWFTPFTKVLDDSNPPFFKWFEGGTTNLCYNAIDRHCAAGKSNKPALIWESTEENKTITYTYGDLKREVSRFASTIQSMGIKKGDRVIIYMPMIPEAAFAMLATVRIGAIHSVVFAGFATESLAERIDDCEAKMIITADAAKRRGKVVPLKPLIDKALTETKKNSIKKVIVFDRGFTRCEMKGERDIFWNNAIGKFGSDNIDCVPVESSHPSYILYTSGTTGKPKGVVRDTGGHIVALNSSMDQVYGATDEDIFWSTSDIGWVVGHSYIVYGPLIRGVPTIMFEGTPDYPDASIWWKTLEKHKVSVMFSAPTAIRMLKKFPADVITKHNTSSLKRLFLAGEPLDEPTYEWATKVLGVNIIDHYWQTESGWPMLANMAGVELLPLKAGSPTKPVVGYKMEIVDEMGNSVTANTKGHLIVHPPMPPGMMSTVWGEDDRYVETYWQKFPNMMVYATGDYAQVDEDGYYRLLGRSDEVINVSGHRLGTREVEEVISQSQYVAEASAVGVKDELKGEAIASFVVLKNGVEPSEDVVKDIKKLVRDKIGPIAIPRDVNFVKMLPKTRSGKVMRRVLKAICEGEKLGDLSTIEDGASVDEIQRAINEM
ncbi:acetate--CoA ligase [bacterium]|nr:acetate--CoA ligase [bacterium]